MRLENKLKIIHVETLCKGNGICFKFFFFRKKKQQREDKKGTRNIVVPASSKEEKNYLKSLDIILPFSCLNVSSELINKKKSYVDAKKIESWQWASNDISWMLDCWNAISSSSFVVTSKKFISLIFGTKSRSINQLKKYDERKKWRGNS